MSASGTDRVHFFLALDTKMVTVDVTDRFVAVVLALFATWLAAFVAEPNCACLRAYNARKPLRRELLVGFLVFYALVQLSDAVGVAIVPPGPAPAMGLVLVHLFFLLTAADLLRHVFAQAECRACARHPAAVSLAAFAAVQALLLACIPFLAFSRGNQE